MSWNKSHFDRDSRSKPDDQWCAASWTKMLPFSNSSGMDAPFIKAVNAKPLHIRTKENKLNLVQNH